MQHHARMKNLDTQKAPPSEAEFIDTPQFLAKVPISRRTLQEWRDKGLIPWVNTKGRRVLFHWPSVQQALLRQQRNGEQA